MKSSALILILTLSILPVLAIPLHKVNDPKRIAQAVKENNIAFLEDFITAENIDDCYELGNAQYNLLAISIKLDAPASFEYIVDHADLEKVCSGKTALMYATKYGHLEMVQALIEKGADPSAMYKSRTAIDYAKKYKQQEILDYLQSI